MATIVIKNIGEILTGDIAKPVAEGNTIVVVDGKISAVGGEAVASGVQADKVIDAAGATVAPGLFDTHVHVSVGDYAHRQKAVGFIEAELQGGVTTVISAGECHMPGRPKDPVGTKCMAIFTHKSFENARPAGVKVHGGAVILEKGLTEKDFEEMKAEGLWIVGEIGLGSVKNPEDAAPMVEWAHKNGFKVQMHTGGTSIPGSSTVTADRSWPPSPTLSPTSTAAPPLCL